MVKTKGGRSMNPTDAYRKEERRKQVNRNKLERKLQREAHRKINNADSLRDELRSLIAAGDEGAMNKTMRLKKKVLRDAYDQALRKRKETELRSQMMEGGTEEQGEEDTDIPLPTGVLSLQQILPVPAPPPLPPGKPPVREAQSTDTILPPPPGPPPGYVLPPPPGPPPGMYPMGQPPQPMYSHMPQGGPVSGGQPIRRPTTEEVVRDHKPTITAAATVVKKPLAQNDKSITSMVPASVMIRREKPRGKAKGGVRKPDIAPGVPTDPTPKKQPTNEQQPTLDQRLATFLSEVSALGAFEK